MKKTTAFLAAFLLVGSAQAVESPLTPDELLGRLQVTAEIFATDPGGQRVLEMSDRSAVWTMAHAESDRGGARKLEMHWGNTSRTFGEVLMNQTWTVDSAGAIHVSLQQFARREMREGKMEFVDLVKQAEIEVKDLAPILWESATPPAGKRVVVRLTPGLGAGKPKAVEKLVVAGKEAAVFDSKGTLWADHVTFAGTYVAIGTPAGMLLLSFYPFQGAQPIGVADGPRLDVKLADRKVSLVSAAPFVPGQATALVYARYEPKRVQGHGTRLNASDNEAEFLQTALSDGE